MFHSLRTRLTLLYGLLFALTLVVVAVTVRASIHANARATIAHELAASGAVYERLWALRTSRLRDATQLLARDYGFRAAAATRDAATVDSALSNLRQRLGADLAFVVTIDGDVIGAREPAVAAHADTLWRLLDRDMHAEGVIGFGGDQYQAVAQPVLAPDLQGWVIFAARLDSRELRALEKLAAVPLSASVLVRPKGGKWRGAEAIATAGEAEAITRFVETTRRSRATTEGSLVVGGREEVATVRTLATFGGEGSAALLLRYPLALALAPYRPLELKVLSTGVGALAIVLVGGWLIARRLTRPIAALDRATAALRRGEVAAVPVESADELGRLADSFNQMAIEIDRREREILHAALNDAATDLPNRRALEAEVDAMARNVPAGAEIAVVALRIERFDTIRGALGFELAEQFVGAVGRSISTVADGATVARVSNAVLAVAVCIADSEAAVAAARRLVGAVSSGIGVGGQRVDVTLAAGIDIDRAANLAVGRLIDRAVVAADQAIAAKRDFHRFDLASYGDPAAGLSLMGEMLDAIAAGQLVLHYQPKLDLRLGRATSAEALVRWRHPVRGMLRPDLFIGMAEETGHIRELTDWVIAQAIADRETLALAGHRLDISINISGRSMGDSAFAAHALARLGRAVDYICLEITETHMMDNPEIARANMQALADAGVAISIDDYGAGYSSLAYLKDIPATELKIDRTFIKSIDSDARDVLLVKSTIDLAHGLGMKVVAEGIENATTLAVLQTLGCDYAQGYLIARPAGLADFADWLSAGTAKRIALAA